MRMKTTSLFQRDFTLVVIGQIISLFGNAILRFALPLYLLRETGSSALFGTVSACSFLPMIVLSMVGGILADRVNKRNIMVILDFSTAAVITCFYLALGRLPLVPLLIVVLMLLYGISGTYQPAVQASIPVLVPAAKLMEGNAVINQVNTLSGLLGPVIGGMMFGMWGILPILLLSIACFAISAVMEIFIHIPYQKQDVSQGIFAIAKADLLESCHFVRQEKPVFFSIGMIICAFNLVLSAAIIIGSPVLVIQALGLTDEMLGFTQGALALGGLCGGMLTPVVMKKYTMKDAHLLLVICSLCVAVMGISLLLNPPAIVSYWVITVMCFVAMAASTLFVIQMFTLIQQQTPPQLIGKVMAALMSIGMCASPIGQSIYGLLFDAFLDTSWAILIGASGAALLISLYSKKTFQTIETA